MDEDAINAALRHQDGVITRGQVLSADGADFDIARLVRRRQWAAVHPGVYVDHTGPLTPDQRAWAAVLFYEPAAITGRAALARWGVRTGRATTPDVETIEIAVDRSRRVQPVPGISVVRLAHFDERVLGNLSPPRVRLEHVVLDLAASAADVAEAVAVVADACGSRRTTATRLLAALEERPRLRHRRMLGRILRDVATGAHSLLEWLYLTRVERPHGLPVGARQRAAHHGRSRAFRDVEYVEQRLIVELDGRLGHELAQDVWHDLDRDVAAAIDERLTVRLGWRHCLDPCAAAAAVGRLLATRSWQGRPTPCGAHCRVR